MNAILAGPWSQQTVSLSGGIIYSQIHKLSFTNDLFPLFFHQDLILMD